MACRFCERIKKLRKVDVLLIICICLFLYIGNQMQLKSYREQKEQAQHKNEQKPTQAAQHNLMPEKSEQERLKAYEDLQRKCYFGQDAKACDELKKY